MTVTDPVIWAAWEEKWGYNGSEESQKGEKVNKLEVPMREKKKTKKLWKTGYERDKVERQEVVFGAYNVCNTDKGSSVFIVSDDGSGWQL